MMPWLNMGNTEQTFRHFGAAFGCVSHALHMRFINHRRKVLLLYFPSFHISDSSSFTGNTTLGKMRDKACRSSSTCSNIAVNTTMHRPTTDLVRRYLLPSY